MHFRHALLPGSYDPITLGHLSLISRAVLFCDRVTACVMINPKKQCLFSMAQRLSFLNLACREIKNADSASFEGTEPVFCRKNGCDIIVKGIRNDADLKYELAIVTDWAKENRCDYLVFVGEPNHPETKEKGSTGFCEYRIKGTDNPVFSPPPDVPPMLLLPCEKGLEKVSSTAVRRYLSENRSIASLVPSPCLKAVEAAFLQKRK